jgi:hypothetical protein
MPQPESLVTDRTQQHVSRILNLMQQIAGGTATQAEIDEFLANRGDGDADTWKGAYNYTDLNRVGAAVTRITERLASAGIYIATVGKSDWTEEDYNNVEALDYYLRDISLVRGAIAVTSDTPPVPDDLQGLYWWEANNIEKILEDVDYLITNMMQAWYYSGDLYSGEV